MMEEQSESRLRIYGLYLKARERTPLAGRFMEYRWSKLPDPLEALWIPYSQLFEEFAREIANTINNLTNHVHRLQAWSTALDTLLEDERIEATHEFVDVLGAAALGLPYVIKSRLAYAATHLCHQANMARDFDGWKDVFPPEGTIYFDSAEPFGQGWKTFRRFRQKAEIVGGAAFKDATGDFRNAYNHRFPRRLVFGMTGIVKRCIDEASGAVRYAIGGDNPMTLDEVARLLSVERDRSYAAFDAFQALVREHEDAIKSFGGGA
jgi:hypothetical protein